MFVANPDEEIGSPTSTPHIREIAADSRRLPRPRVRPRERRHRLVAQGHPRRCGSRSTGRAAHAGVEPEKGRSAILEAAADRRASCTPSTAAGRASPSTSASSSGGTRPNVVAEQCSLEVDVRGRAARADLEAAEAEIRARSPRRPSSPTRPSRSSEMARWWPMEKLERSRPARRPRAGRSPSGLGFTVARCRDRRRVRREHDGRDGRADARRARARSAGIDHSPARVPRGRLDRAADRARWRR